jgi:hypothetical protein
VSVVLRPISRSAADALLARRTPTDVEVASDHPTEFSAGIAEAVGGGSPLGPFFVHRAQDEVVVGEIGGGFIAADTVEIGGDGSLRCERQARPPASAGAPPSTARRWWMSSAIAPLTRQ